jgi:hypothetical protein
MGLKLMSPTRWQRDQHQEAEQANHEPQHAASITCGVEERLHDLFEY